MKNSFSNLVLSTITLNLLVPLSKLQWILYLGIHSRLKTNTLVIPNIQKKYRNKFSNYLLTFNQIIMSISWVRERLHSHHALLSKISMTLPQKIRKFTGTNNFWEKFEKINSKSHLDVIRKFHFENFIAHLIYYFQFYPTTLRCFF